MKGFGWLVRLIWGEAKTPEEEAARAEAVKRQVEAKRTARMDHGRYERRN